MPSKITVYNQAAARIGVFESGIQSDTEVSKIVEVCNLFYDDSVEYVLAEFPWKFAEKRVVLAASGTAPSNWTYSYAYPTDCIAARVIVIPGLRNPRAAQMIPYQSSTPAQPSRTMSTAAPALNPPFTMPTW